MKLNVLVEGRRDNSIAIAGRMHSSALQSAGYELSWKDTHSPEYAPSFETSYVHLNPPAAASYQSFLTRRNIGYWTWEAEGFMPETWITESDKFDQIWVPSKYVADCFRKFIPSDKIHVVPHYATCGVFRYRTIGRPCTFLTVLDARSRLERKNPMGVIAAFKAAFSPSVNVRLIVKCHGHGPQLIQDLRNAIAGDGRISVVAAFLGSHELRNLYLNSDALVSLHRSEGFGLNILNAMANGLPVISTAYSGSMDFTTELNSYLVDFKTVPADDFYYQGGVWAEPCLESAARQMRSVFNRHDVAIARAVVAYRDVSSKFTFVETMQKSKQAISQLKP